MSEEQGGGLTLGSCQLPTVQVKSRSLRRPRFQLPRMLQNIPALTMKSDLSFSRHGSKLRCMEDLFTIVFLSKSPGPRPSIQTPADP